MLSERSWDKAVWPSRPLAQVLQVCLHVSLPRIRQLVSWRTAFPSFLFATESSVVGSHKQRAPVSSLTSACPDVEPYLSRPQVDSNTPGFSENVSFISVLLKLSKRSNNTASFRNMSKQLLSAEAESQSISSLPPSMSVSHWLTETNNRTWGSEDTKVIKQHKDCLQACHKGFDFIQDPWSYCQAHPSGAGCWPWFIGIGWICDFHQDFRV